MAARNKPKELTLPQYCGLVGRVCGILGITPTIHPNDSNQPSKSYLEARALARWCQEQQKNEQERKK